MWSAMETYADFKHLSSTSARHNLVPSVSLLEKKREPGTKVAVIHGITNLLSEDFNNLQIKEKLFTCSQNF